MTAGTADAEKLDEYWEDDDMSELPPLEDEGMFAVCKLEGGTIPTTGSEKKWSGD